MVVEFSKTDRYGRLVGKLVVNGRDVCLEQLKLASRGFTGKMSTSYRRKIAGYTIKRKAPRGLESADFGAIHRLNHLGTSAIRVPSVSLLLQRPRGEAIIGNKRSGIYHRPDCPDYSKIAPTNREFFSTLEAAELAGYRKARNSP